MDQLALYYIIVHTVCRTYGLLGRVPYAAHSVIFIIEEGISWHIFFHLDVHLFVLVIMGGLTCCSDDEQMVTAMNFKQRGS